MHVKMETENGNERRNHRPTWTNIAVVVLFAAAVSGWFMTFGGYREKVSSLEGQIILLRGRLNGVEVWQRDWPSQGELIMDRAQNTKIDELLRRVNKLEGGDE